MKHETFFSSDILFSPKFKTTILLVPWAWFGDFILKRCSLCPLQNVSPESRQFVMGSLPFSPGRSLAMPIFSREPKHECKTCGRTFKRGYHLNRHNQEVHAQARPYTCTMCPKAFSRPEHLKVHLMKHSEERPYTCEICGKTFTRVDALKSHKLLHRIEECDPLKSGSDSFQGGGQLWTSSLCLWILWRVYI
jgi:uncharacterized Zn-finger protein